jgi:ornithine cyclodeaminase/alanine dehydrogenase-like protein (mu-crystallin family)
VTLLLSGADVVDLLTMEDAIGAVENAFRLLGERRVEPPAIATVLGDGGGFHIKAARIGAYFAAKVNGNFFSAVPRIKGVIVLGDATDGTVLAVLDSIEITNLRTAAATAVAAIRLARRDARSMMIIGCGNQGRSHVRAIRAVRSIERIYALDTNRETALAFARDTGATVVDRPVEADIVITSTPSRSPIFDAPAPGTFVAAVGADNTEKLEIAPVLMASSKVVTDLTSQCVEIGDLHHAIAAGKMARGQVHAELADIVVGKARGRESDEEVIVFDSTGMALQDVATAAIVYERARAKSRGLEFAFA